MAEGPSLWGTPVCSHACERAPLGPSSPPRIPLRGQADSAAPAAGLRRPFRCSVAWPGLAATQRILLSDEARFWGNHSASVLSWPMRVGRSPGRLWVSVLLLALSSCPFQHFAVSASPWEGLAQRCQPPAADCPPIAAKPGTRCYSRNLNIQNLSLGVCHESI